MRRRMDDGKLTMKRWILTAVAVCAAPLSLQARADNFNFTFSGPGVSGTVALTYGAATDSKHTTGFEVTGISGTFSDTNNGLNIVNAAIGGLVPLNYASPEPTNLLTPADFSKFAVASGLEAEGNAISYDNLFFPGGSPPSATDYPFGGGFLDIYGLLFTLGNGDVANIWSNGVPPGGSLDYGVAVATANTSLDYVSGGVAVTPEPSSLWLLGTGLVAALVWGRRGLAGGLMRTRE